MLRPKGGPDELLYRMTLIHPSTFVKKTAYEKCGVFDVSYRYCMDKELLYRMFKAEMQFKYVDKCFTKFKAGGVSDKYTLNVYKEASRMAIENGENKIKVYFIQSLRYVKTKITQCIKNTPLYQIVKSD